MKTGPRSSWFNGQRGLLTVVSVELVIVSLLGWIIIQNTEQSEPAAATQSLSTRYPESSSPGLVDQSSQPAADADPVAAAAPFGESAGVGARSVGTTPTRSGANSTTGGGSRTVPASAAPAGNPTSGEGGISVAPTGNSTAAGSPSVGPPAPAAGPGAVVLDRGITDTTVTIGAICHISGPLRLEFGCIGADSAVREMNAAGGVGGRRLQYKFYDDGLDPQRTKTAVTKLLKEDKIFAWVGGWAPITSNVTIPEFEKDQTPIVFPDSTDNLWFTSPWVFPYGTSVRGYGISTCEYLRQTVKNPKLAVVYYDVRPSVQPKDACVEHLKQKGVEPVSVDQAQLGAPDFTNLVLKWRSLGVNGVAVFIEENSHVRLAQNMDQQGYWVPQVGNGTAASSTIAEQAPRGGEGITLMAPTKSYLGSSAVAQRYRAAMKRFYPKERLHGLGLLAYSQVYQFAETLKLLGNNMTRANLKTVLDGLDVDTNGVLGSRLSYKTPRGKDFDNCFGPWQVKDKAWVDAGDWFCY